MMMTFFEKTPNFGRVYIALIVIISAILAMSSITPKFPTGDADYYGRTAYNLFQYGKFSTSQEDTPENVQTNYYDNPVMPVFYAGVLEIFFDENDVSLACLQNENSKCATALKIMKISNLLWFIPLSLLVFYTLKRIRPNGIKTRYVAFTLMALNVSFLGYMDTFLTEGMAALFLLSLSLGCYEILKAEKISPPFFILSLLSFILLVLIKPVFFYYIPVLGIGVIGFTVFKQYHHIALQIAVIALCAYGAASLWSAHNERIHGKKILSQTGLTVLAVRAEYATMSWNEYKAVYFAFLPDLGSLQLKARLLEKFFDQKDYQRFRDLGEHSQTFYGGWKNPDAAVGARAHNKQGELDYNLVRSASFSVIKENWMMHIALTPAFALRGSFPIVGFLPSSDHALIVEKRAKTILRYSTMLYSLCFYPAFLLLCLAALKQRNTALIGFLLPALFAFGFHAFITHYIPRYSLTSVPVLLVALSILFTQCQNKVKNA